MAAHGSGTDATRGGVTIADRLARVDKAREELDGLPPWRGSAGAEAGSAARPLAYRFGELLDPLPPEDEDPAVLFRGDWLERGQTALLVSVSGAGKSTASTQMAANWAAGRRCAATPTRPLRIGVWQDEDSRRDLHGFADGIRRGLAEEAGEAEAAATIAAAHERIHPYDATGLCGESFLEAVRDTQGRDKCDLLVINPFQSFAGIDLAKNNELTMWLRQGLAPILKAPDAPCAALLVHHTNKIPADKSLQRGMFEGMAAAYVGAGGAELVNFARSILVLRPLEAYGYYALVGAKHGNRLGWTDADGNPTTVVPWAYSREYIYWRTPTREEVEAATAEAARVGFGGGGVADTRRTETDIAPYVTRALDESRTSAGEYGETFGGVTKGALIAAVREMIREDGKRPPSEDRLAGMIDRLPAETVVRTERKYPHAILYGTASDFAAKEARG